MSYLLIVSPLNLDILLLLMIIKLIFFFLFYFLQIFFTFVDLTVLVGQQLGTGIRGHGNPPQGNPELLVVRDKVGRLPGELGVSKSMKCDIFPSVL